MAEDFDNSEVDLRKMDSKGVKETIFVSRRHWVSLDKAFLFFILGVIFLAVGLKLSIRPEIVLLFVALLLVLLFVQVVSWWFSLTILTNGGLEVVSQKGLFRRSVINIPFESIINANFATKGLGQAILGFGTIIIQTQSGDVVLEKMSKPEEKHNIIVRNYDKFRGFEEDED